ncbi:hypothetical protein [Komagataeibacter diospyri]|uniref:hypothetical protein n=1 Tax=Komagataeibacter diospyri TaxID=1932662 RepID=UPI003756B495
MPRATLLAPGGTAAYDYLRPEIFGGPRPMKKSEKALRPIVGDQYWVPGRGAPLDAYGNIQRGEIVRILSRLGLMQGPLQNMTDRTAKRLARKGLNARGQRSEYFIAREKGNGRAKGHLQARRPRQRGAYSHFCPAALIPRGAAGPAAPPASRCSTERRFRTDTL